MTLPVRLSVLLLALGTMKIGYMIEQEVVPATSAAAVRPTKTLQEQPEKPSSQSSQRQSYYYDQRERVASILTFEWQCEDRYPESGGSNNGEQDTSQVSGLSLTSIYHITRTPDLTRIQASIEILKKMPEGGSYTLQKADQPLRWDCYYLGKTGEILLYAPRLSDGTVGSVAIASPGSNGFGLNLPFMASPSGDLVFLAGVSPLRLMGAEISDWKLREVNEQEWVFELKPTDEQKAKRKGLLRFDRVEVRLSRQHGDAPAFVEITRDDEVTRWRSLAYKQIQGVWMPTQVLLEYQSSTLKMRSLYSLVNAKRTERVVFDIPYGTPVTDWRRKGLRLWSEDLAIWSISLHHEPAKDSTVPEESPEIKKWQPELERSLWREMRR